MATILLAEQSIPLGVRIEDCLAGMGYRVVSVADVELVCMVKNHPFDMIIWAVGCFDDNVQKIFEQVRKFSDVPVLGIWPKEQESEEAEPEEVVPREVKPEEVASKEAEPEDRQNGRNGVSVGGQESPLDAMLGLPLDREELEEKVAYYMREAYKRSHDMRLFQYKGLKMSSGSIKKVEMNHKGLDLTVKEYMILSLLMRHRNRIYTKASLYEAVWRQPYTGDDNAVKIHISNLRSKLKKVDPDTKYIETVWGLGYRLSQN